MGHFNRRNQKKEEPLSRFEPRQKLRKIDKSEYYTIAEDAISNSIDDVIFNGKSFNENTKLLETPFGEIKRNEGMLAFSFKNKKVFYEILTKGEFLEENYGNENNLILLEYFEKLYDKYPNEPFLANEVSDYYKALEKLEKHYQLINENYEKYKGYPIVDIAYASHQYKEYDKDVKNLVFGEALNLHEIYPSYKAFDAELISEFYAYLFYVYESRDDLKMARKCVETVKMVDSKKGLILSNIIVYKEKPWLKWRDSGIIVIILLVLLGLIGGLIWGIIALFQWIF